MVGERADRCDEDGVVWVVIERADRCDVFAVRADRRNEVCRNTTKGDARVNASRSPTTGSIGHPYQIKRDKRPAGQSSGQVTRKNSMY